MKLFRAIVCLLVVLAVGVGILSVFNRLTGNVVSILPEEKDPNATIGVASAMTEDFSSGFAKSDATWDYVGSLAHIRCFSDNGWTSPFSIVDGKLTYSYVNELVAHFPCIKMDYYTSSGVENRKLSDMSYYVIEFEYDVLNDDDMIDIFASFFLRDLSNDDFNTNRVSSDKMFKMLGSGFYTFVIDVENERALMYLDGVLCSSVELDVTNGDLDLNFMGCFNLKWDPGTSSNASEHSFSIDDVSVHVFGSEYEGPIRDFFNGQFIRNISGCTDVEAYYR